MLPRRISTNASYTPIGAMTNKIDLLRPTNRRDNLGDPVAPDVFMKNVWAKISIMAPRYIEKPETTTTEASYKIVIRYIPGITSAMIVRSEGKTYNIQAVDDPDGLRVELRLTCYLRNDGVSGVQA